jgi:hypothetical protein
MILEQQLTTPQGVLSPPQILLGGRHLVVVDALDRRNDRRLLLRRDTAEHLSQMTDLQLQRPDRRRRGSEPTDVRRASYIKLLSSLGIRQGKRLWWTGRRGSRWGQPIRP